LYEGVHGLRNGSTSLIKRRSPNTQWQLQVQTAQREMAAVGQTRAQQSSTFSAAIGE
jgi:hypothetical protein